MASSGGKWAYIVVFASFIVHMVSCGIAYSCGAFYLKFLEEFDSGAFKTSWTGSLLLAMIPIAGIPSTVVVYRLGVRASVILGGILAAGGFALASFASEVWQTYTTLGVMTGAGFGFALTPSVMILSDYFPTKLDLAVGFAISGVGLGMTFFPVVIQHLLDMYSWQRVFYILSGTCGSLVIAGALMHPISNQHKLYKKHDILRIFEPSLCRSVAFNMLCLSNFIWSFGLSILYHQLPQYAEGEGWGKDAMVLIAIIGISSFSSRAMFQLFSHAAKLDNISIVLCTIGLTAVLTGLFPELFKHQAGHIGYAIMLGLHTGFWSTFMSHVCTEIIGTSYVALGKGFIFFSLSIGLLLGAPVAGWIYELKSDYDINFYLAGACLLVASIIMTGITLGGCYYRPNMDLSQLSASLTASLTATNSADQSLMANNIEQADEHEEEAEEISTRV